MIIIFDFTGSNTSYMRMKVILKKRVSNGL